jgi:hypothetical protein
LGQDATTAAWPNRGSLGGSLTAVNIRDEDIGLSTPFTDGTKSVRFYSLTGGTRRYYRADDTTFADFDTEDMVWEVVYTREAADGGFANINFIKRDWSSAANQGYAVYSSTITNLNFLIKSSGAGSQQFMGATTGGYSWQHMSGFRDNSDSATTGFQIAVGSQSTGVASQSPGSLSNSVPFTVGDSTVDGYYTNASTTASRVAYIAIWRRSDWLAGGATNASQHLTEMRARQAYLSGIVESVAGRFPSTYSSTQYRSTKTWNGAEWGHHLLGPGMMAPDQYILPSTQEPVAAFRFDSPLTCHATAENFSTGWTHANNSATTLYSQDLPTSNIRGITASGVYVVGTAGTNPKTATIRWSSSLGANSRVFISVWARAGAAPCFYTRFSDNAGGSNRYAHVRMSDGYVSLGNNVNNYAAATKYVNGWWLTEFSSTNTVLSSTDLIFGWSDDIGTFDLTSDGYAVDGYMWGWNGVTATSTTYPQQLFPYFGAAAAANLGPTLVWAAAPHTAVAPYSLWWEHMSEWNVNGFGTTAYAAQVSTDGNNAAYFTTGAAIGNTVIASTGVISTTTQWVQTSPTQTGNNTAGSGQRVRWAGSWATDDIKLYNTDGTSISPDTSAAVPTNMTNLRWGNSAAGTVAGRGIQYTRIGVKNVASTDSKGPPGSGIPE